MTHAIIIPVYKNAENIPHLLQALSEVLGDRDPAPLVVFVVDGSPDNSYALLAAGLPACPFPAKLLLLSRNFGSFEAIRAGLNAVEADAYGVMAADLQEPPELVLSFLDALSQDEADITVGRRVARDDPWMTRVLSGTYWALYRRLVQPRLPPGGVDVFGCNRKVRDELIQLTEAHSSIVSQLYWMGYRLKEFDYQRRPRLHGTSAWTFRQKLFYMADSVLSFTNLPIRFLLFLGGGGMILSVLVAVIAITARLLAHVSVPGYTALLVAIMFFGALNCLGLGIIGSYVWRNYENSKHRPNFLIATEVDIDRDTA